MSVSVIRPGVLSSLQDAGRSGHAALGVGRAGAMDLPAWQLANALVGNSDGEAAIECTLAGPGLRFEQAAVIALTGAAIAAHVDQRAIPMWTTCQLPAGSVLQLGGMASGCRTYLAVRGGFDVPPLLGSRSSDLHAHIGHEHGRALRAGDVLPIGKTSPLPGLSQHDDAYPCTGAWIRNPGSISPAARWRCCTAATGRSWMRARRNCCMAAGSS
jgi:antagonist of KipI